MKLKALCRWWVSLFVIHNSFWSLQTEPIDGNTEMGISTLEQEERVGSTFAKGWSTTENHGFTSQQFVLSKGKCFVCTSLSCYVSW